MLGTRRLFDFAHDNPALRIDGSDYVHAAPVLAGLKRLVALNSAIEVDLTGQINAEVAGARYVGAIGGQPDFLRGAAVSDGGVPVIALASTARGVSRIVPRIASGVVTTPRSDAGVIVTEHGVADLRGQSLGERVRRMIAIADPAARDSLSVAARAVMS